jgi:hypothetical protein
VVNFQCRQDVDHFQQEVRERFAEFGLELAEEKTRRILFGRFAGVTCLRHGLGRPETFEFLGFKHVCGVDRAGRFALIRIPSVRIVGSSWPGRGNGSFITDTGDDGSNSNI